MGNFQIDHGINEKFYTAIVVREAVNGQKVFHKYRNIPQKPLKVERFQRSMYWLHADQGKLIHINYYSKESAKFVFQWRCEWG